METTIEIYTFPALWASYLINGESSGLDQYDKVECDIETMDLGACINVAESKFFGQYKGIGYELTEYTFRKDY